MTSSSYTCDILRVLRLGDFADDHELVAHAIRQAMVCEQRKECVESALCTISTASRLRQDHRK
jgi:hypothetical protein